MKDLAIKFILLTALLTVSTVVTQAQLQIALDYNWRPPNPVREIMINEPGTPYAGITKWDASGRPYISFNIPRLNMPPEALLFLRVHEYGHVNKGHTPDRYNPSTAGMFEAEADCWAGQQLYASDPQILNSVLTAFDRMGNTGGDWSHGTGAQMAAVIRACIQKAPTETQTMAPTETIASAPTLEPLSITRELKLLPCDVSKEDYNLPPAKRRLLSQDSKIALLNLSFRGESLVDMLKSDSRLRMAINKEELANDKLEDAKDYFTMNARRSDARDTRALATRREAREAVREFNQEQRENVQVCQEAVMIKAAIQYMVVEAEKSAAAATATACQVNGQSINLVASTWTSTGNPELTPSLTFGSNGDLSISLYYPQLEATSNRRGTWSCTGSTLKLKAKIFSDDEREYELGFDGSKLYIKDRNTPSGRTWEFIKRN